MGFLFGIWPVARRLAGKKACHDKKIPGSTPFEGQNLATGVKAIYLTD
jgi:hypothetical protein